LNIKERKEIVNATTIQRIREVTEFMCNGTNIAAAIWQTHPTVAQHTLDAIRSAIPEAPATRDWQMPKQSPMRVSRQRFQYVCCRLGQAKLG